jgi:hypothetical protein
VAATKQFTVKNIGTMLANGHEGTKQASVLACRSRSASVRKRLGFPALCFEHIAFRRDRFRRNPNSSLFLISPDATNEPP